MFFYLLQRAISFWTVKSPAEIKIKLQKKKKKSCFTSNMIWGWKQAAGQTPTWVYSFNEDCPPYLGPSGTWRCGLWSQCSQHQTWCRTGSCLHCPLHFCAVHAGHVEVVCRCWVWGWSSDASQTSGRPSDRSQRWRLRPLWTSSSPLIMCAAAEPSPNRNIQVWEQTSHRTVPELQIPHQHHLNPSRTFLTSNPV